MAIIIKRHYQRRIPVHPNIFMVQHTRLTLVVSAALASETTLMPLLDVNYTVPGSNINRSALQITHVVIYIGLSSVNCDNFLMTIHGDGHQQ